MKYVLPVYLDDHALSDTERQECYRDSAQVARDLNPSGHSIDESPLELAPMATSLRLRSGKCLVTNSPFAETREQLGRYYLIDATDLDEAIGIAARVPVARMGTIKIRPVLEITGLPD